MSYGSLEEKQPNISIEMATSSKISDDFDEFPFGEKEIFENEEFWREIRTTYEEGKKKNLGKSKAQRIVRAKWLLRKYKDEHPGRDFLVHMLTVINKQYKEYILDENCFPKYSSFVFEVAEFTSILLEFEKEKDKKEQKYRYSIPMEDGTVKTILHLAAESGLHEVIEKILEYEPSLINLTTLMKDDDGEEEKWYPLDFALRYNCEKDEPMSCCAKLCKCFQSRDEDADEIRSQERKRADETASLLIKEMENERVRNLFQDNGFEPARYHFKTYIEKGYMNKTVVAILDCMMDPDWPFVPKDTEEKKDYVLSIPNMPFRYHFYYRLLDGDDEGRPPKDEDNNPTDEFNYRAKTCLQMVAETPKNRAIIEHPVVRLLVRRKWKKYGSFLIRSYFALYVFFLVVLSTALFAQPLDEDHATYNGWNGRLRLTCEVLTLILTFFYFISECIQFYYERCNYFNEWSNWFDMGGMLLIIAIIPFRFLGDQKTEWIISAFAFFINFLRVFKYFSAFKTLGLYVNTFKEIIYYDILKFAVILIITILSFTGAIFLILRATDGLKNLGDASTRNSTFFWIILLQETRAVAEAQGFADDYTKFENWVIIILMINMFALLVVLLNVLIGQISYRYEKALNSAIISYDIERTKLITRLESTPFPKLFNNRVNYYKEGQYVDNDALADELLQDWLALKGEEKITARQNVVKEMVVSKIKRNKEVEKLSLDEPE